MICVNQIKEWAISNNVEAKTIDCFWKSFNRYRNEEQNEFVNVFGDVNIENLSTPINTVSLKLGNWPQCDYVHVIATLEIWYNNSHVGNYELLFNLDAEIDDDYFIIF